jgi:nucleotide-binding universal stress UspA family protein
MMEGDKRSGVTMFKSIVLPLDLEESGDRPIPFIRGLASVGTLPVELLTVSSAGIEHHLDEFELERRARLLGDAACTVTVLYSNDPAEMLTSYVADRPDSLVVMATNARGPIGEKLFGSVSEALLANQVAPMLLFGPHWHARTATEAPTLIVALDDSEESEAVLATAERWTSTFGGPTELVEFAAESASDEELERVVHHLERCLRGRWPDGAWKVLDGRRPADALLDHGNEVENAVVAMASGRWTDEHTHLRSVTRAVTHRSRFPVLVVPRAPAAA